MKPWYASKTIHGLFVAALGALLALAGQPEAVWLPVLAGGLGIAGYGRSVAQGPLASRMLAAGVAAPLALLLGCGTLQPASPEAAVDAGCEAALAASTEALAYLQSPAGRDDSPSDREAIVEGMRGARDACFAGRAALQGDGSPQARAEALQVALLALAARVPAVESDPEFRRALGRLLAVSAELSEEVQR